MEKWLKDLYFELPCNKSYLTHPNGLFVCLQFPAGPMGLIIKPCKLNLANGTNLEVLMVTDSSQSSHPEICAGDIIGGINNNPIVAKEGTNWQQFYSGALKWVKSNQDVVKNLKLFRRAPGQPVQVSDGR